ncbi:hypothetical protein CRUP_000463 [Coryphaenoides rupestris]|nr:hypothetical protein CRUP_000463 [Coryphaenoides rupestris]
MWVEHHVLVNREVKAEVAQRVKGMLQRTKYSRLRNDSLSSLDDQHPDPPLAPLHAQAPHPAPPHVESSTLRGFIPRMASISLLGGLGVLTHKSGHRNTDRRTDERPVSDADWTLGSASHCHVGSTSTLQRTAKRPVTLQGCPLHSRQGSWSRWKIPPPAEEGSTSGPEDTMVHHHHVESNLEFSGSSVILTVSTDSMSLTTACPLQTVAHHSIQAISFASGGDSVLEVLEL